MPVVTEAAIGTVPLHRFHGTLVAVVSAATSFRSVALSTSFVPPPGGNYEVPDAAKGQMTGESVFATCPHA